MYTLSTISLLSNCPPPPCSPPPPCPPSRRSVHPGRLRPTEWCHKGQVHFVRPTPTATYDSRALTNYYQIWRGAQGVRTTLHNWQLWLPSLTYLFDWISSTSFKSWTAPKGRSSMQSANFDQKKYPQFDDIYRCALKLQFVRDFSYIYETLSWLQSRVSLAAGKDFGTEVWSQFWCWFQKCDWSKTTHCNVGESKKRALN